MHRRSGREDRGGKIRIGETGATSRPCPPLLDRYPRQRRVRPSAVRLRDLVSKDLDEVVELVCVRGLERLVHIATARYQLRRLSRKPDMAEI
jgi:hypothetical protein